MLYDYNEMLEHAKNKFHLVNLLVRRGRELNRWAGLETDIIKIIPIAIEELLEGKLNNETKKEEPSDEQTSKELLDGKLNNETKKEEPSDEQTS